MDEEMQDTIELTFTAVEIDPDYEFDAARYFDFSREESLAEAREAELWFDSAESYPPSPFVMKLVPREDVLLDNVNTSPKARDFENTALIGSDSNIGLGQDFSVMDGNNRDCEGMDRGFVTNLQSGNLQKFQNQLQQLPTGLRFYNHMAKDDSSAKTKSTVKRPFLRTSTLMKPTASQLAKQNPSRQMGNRRLQKLLVENNARSSNNPCGIESQAAKRQKLEGGHLRKVADIKQQTNLVHKVPKKDGTIEGNSALTKLKLTIPREPDLETAHRAQRIRPKNSTELERVTSTARRFKALPLNKKILEAPSLLLPKRRTPQLPEFQEFHLKTSERAMQQICAVSSSSIYCSNSDKLQMLHKPSTNSVAERANGESRRPNVVDAPKQEKCETVHSFKAYPLNKKIFSSKGDIGVFRNSKKEITVPMEFNFHTEKRVQLQHNPPIELFNKLSLIECQPNAQSQLKLPRPTCMPTKGLKENRLGSFKQEQEVQIFGGRQTTQVWGKQPGSVHW